MCKRWRHLRAFKIGLVVDRRPDGVKLLRCFEHVSVCFVLPFHKFLSSDSELHCMHHAVKPLTTFVAVPSCESCNPAKTARIQTRRRRSFAVLSEIEIL